MPFQHSHLQNLGYSGVNIPIGSIVSAAFVSPGGIAGTTGITGAQGIQGSPGVTGATGKEIKVLPELLDLPEHKVHQE